MTTIAKINHPVYSLKCFNEYKKYSLGVPGTNNVLTITNYEFQN